MAGTKFKLAKARDKTKAPIKERDYPHNGTYINVEADDGDGGGQKKPTRACESKTVLKLEPKCYRHDTDATRIKYKT